jgi:hypothetical protein
MEILGVQTKQATHIAKEAAVVLVVPVRPDLTIKAATGVAV